MENNKNFLKSRLRKNREKIASENYASKKITSEKIYIKPTSEKMYNKTASENYASENYDKVISDINKLKEQLQIIKSTNLEDINLNDIEEKKDILDQLNIKSEFDTISNGVTLNTLDQAIDNYKNVDNVINVIDNLLSIQGLNSKSNIKSHNESSIKPHNESDKNKIVESNGFDITTVVEVSKTILQIINSLSNTTGTGIIPDAIEDNVFELIENLKYYIPYFQTLIGGSDIYNSIVNLLK